MKILKNTGKKFPRKRKCKDCGQEFTQYNPLQNRCNSCVIKEMYSRSKPKCKPLKKPVVHKNSTTENKKIKKITWNWFSKYIRLRDCLKTTKTMTRGICYTCGKEFDFKDLQAGHCISGRGNYILLDEDCVFAQCYRCNIALKGNYDVFIPKIIRERSLEWFEEKKRLSKISIKKNWLEELEKYKEKYFKLTYGKPKKLPF